MRFRVFLLLFILLFLCSCGSEEEAAEFPLYKNVARQVNDDGWVYTFVYEYEKENVEPIEGLINFTFNGFNIRYRYADDYYEIYRIEKKDGSVEEQKYRSGALIFGGSKETAEDSAKTDEILMNSTKEELLRMEEDSIEFSVLDKSLFFRLMNEALTGKPQAEATEKSDWNRPLFAALAENSFLDGYKFQVCFLCETGLIDVCYIDVLYQTGPREIDYVQLSDLVDAGEATQEQVECFNVVRELAIQLEEQESFLANEEQYKTLRFGVVDMSRLNGMLNNIQSGDYMQYATEPYYD